MWLDHEERPRKPWRVRWRARGRMHTQRFASKPEAIAFMAKLQRDAAPLTNGKLTVAEWIDKWFATHGVAWERSTRMQRASILELHVKPQLGAMRLIDLSRHDVQVWRSGLRRTGRSGNTINAANRVLSAAIGASVEDGLRETNPCIGLKPVPQRPVQRRPIPVRDVEAIRHQLVQPRDRLVVSLLAYAGLRPGEMVGLTWGQVRDNTLLIDRSVSGRGGQVKSTKTRAVRTVPLLSPVSEDLKALQAERHSLRFTGRTGEPLALENPVIANRRGGPIDFHNWASRVWRPATHELGLTCKPYECRHTYVSLLISAGHDPVQVAAWAGHSVNLCMSTYAHLFAERQGVPGEPAEDVILRVRHDISRAS